MITNKEPMNVSEFSPESLGQSCEATAAFIPTFVVNDRVNLRGLHDAIVRVISTNETYYVDHWHRNILLSQGPVFKNNYNFEDNPLNISGGVVVDRAQRKAGFYCPDGTCLQFEVTELPVNG